MRNKNPHHQHELSNIIYEGSREWKQKTFVFHFIQTDSPPRASGFTPTTFWSDASFSNPLSCCHRCLSTLLLCRKAAEANESEFLWNWRLAQSAGHRNTAASFLDCLFLSPSFTSWTELLSVPLHLSHTHLPPFASPPVINCECTTLSLTVVSKQSFQMWLWTWVSASVSHVLV